jgi:hypothetical protein
MGGGRYELCCFLVFQGGADGPEFGGGLWEFDADLGESAVGGAEAGDAAFGFVLRLGIFEEKLLADDHFVCQDDQGAVSADGDAEGLLLEGLLLGGFSADDQGHVQKVALTAPAFGNCSWDRWFWDGHFALLLFARARLPQAFYTAWEELLQGYSRGGSGQLEKTCLEDSN